MVMIVFRTIRNHWKKSLFGATVVTWGSHHFYTKHQINQLMRDYCKQAQHLGDQRVDPFQACPHITVLLNPLSKGRKCRTQFDHYVAPILHCAGVRVSVFETESRGQAEQLMKVMANTDGVLIAGGDGTVHEAITGWLQRPEVERIGRSIAIAVLPLGKRNRTFNLLHDQSNKAAEEESSPFWQSSKVNEVRQLAECTLRVAKNERRQANVMQVQLSFDQSESTTLYALNALEFGQMSWLTTRFSKYWYLGQHLGEYYAMIRNTFWKSLDDLLLFKSLELQYEEPCSGCSKCYKTFDRPEANRVQVQPQSSWAKWIGLGSSGRKLPDTPEQVTLKKMRLVQNDHCGQSKRVALEDVLNVRIQNEPNSSPNQLLVRWYSKRDAQGKFDFFNDVRPLARTSDRQTNENELIVRNVSFHLPESLLPKLDVKQSITSEIPAFETIAPIEESVVDVRPTVETDTEQKATADVEPSKHSLSLTDLQSEESDSAQLQIDSELYRRVPNVRLTSLPAQLTLYK